MNTETLREVLVRRCVAEPAIVPVVEALSQACLTVADALRRSAFRRHMSPSGSANANGDLQKPLDLLADAIFENHLEAFPGIAALVSEERDKAHWLKPPRGGDLVVCFDPLDGSSNIEVGMVVGSIFSIFRLPEGIEPDTLPAALTGMNQLIAGYALYGPVTELVLGMTDWVDGFCLEPDTSQFRCTHSDLRIAHKAREIAVNASRHSNWPAPVARFVSDAFTAVEAGGQGCNLRWTASMVADIHRVLLRGGVFLYPADNHGHGRLRLVYEANPIAFLMRAAGAAATDGRHDLLSLPVTDLHQKVGVVLGARDSVETLRSLFSES
ncbi:class 1 fructose-bisphosphatase [Phaeovulum sp. W22_SRMD_FR3]|uniref:class 1 fructose-bisphosphatase n=1 Tax=Phaeovulum sp. W22_SRMD_FR3 TaxID=3240274 RepID=UPI003F943953